jgi:hypothetical protein
MQQQNRNELDRFFTLKKRNIKSETQAQLVVLINGSGKRSLEVVRCIITV